MTLDIYLRFLTFEWLTIERIKRISLCYGLTSWKYTNIDTLFARKI